jgi:hypothetical protein
MLTRYPRYGGKLIGSGEYGQQQFFICMYYLLLTCTIAGCH